MRRAFGFLARCGTGIGLIALVFYVLDITPADLFHIFDRVDLVSLLALVLPIFLLDRVLMTYKWRLLLHAAGVQIPLLKLLKIYLISGFAGTFLPVSIGADLTRLYHLHRLKHNSADVAASIVLERLFGFFAVLTWAVPTLPILAWMYPESRELFLIAGSIIFVIPLCALLAMNRVVLSTIRKILPRLIGERLSGLSARLYWSFHAYRTRGRVLAIFYGLSVIETGFPIVISMIMALALKIEIPLGVIPLVAPMVLIVIRLPISLGGIGTFEWSYVSLYGMVGMKVEEALSFGLLADAQNILLNSMGGLILLYYLIRGRRTETDPVAVPAASPPSSSEAGDKTATSERAL